MFRARSLSCDPPIDLTKMEIPDDEYYQQTERLDYFYRLVKEQLLKYQSPTIGLFPIETIGRSNCSNVRDCVYTAVSVWALALAYRKIDDDYGRTYELEQSAVKCMRGILYCYMRQADKVEQFKTNQSEDRALHSSYHVMSGNTLPESEHHLQIDAVSLYLLYMVQMISSGVQIIYTLDEVAFVQNLVYYVERAYRTPDFGMWGRGNKYNTGKCEVNASSIGMAKAALEATNGFNLFGREGASWSVLYVDPDAHGRNRTILESLLPRESSSKNTDASLIPTCSFPAFAVDNQELKTVTLEKVTRKLKGNYGFRRFLRDGYGTVVEDQNRPYYKPAELKSFDSIECEWPMFFAYMIIDGVFKGDDTQVAEYYNLLRPLMLQRPSGLSQMPKYYYVTRDHIESERKRAHSQIRLPSAQGQGSNIFLWGQSLYIIACLLMEKLLDKSELDPIGRYLDISKRGRSSQINTKYSAFEGTPKDMTVQMAFIAESTRLQATLATYGIQSQTPTQVEPIQIWPHNELIKAYKYIGHSKKLNLTGRPSRPFGSIGTSKIYRILGRTVLCYPLQFDLTDFYMYQDMSLLVDDIKGLVAFVRKSWKMSGRPTFCILIKEEHFSGSQASEMLDMLVMFKMGDCNGIRVRVDRLQTLISQSFVEHLDFQVPDGCAAQLLFSPMTELNVDILPMNRSRRPSTPGPREEGQWTEQDLQELHHKPSWEIIDHIRQFEALNWQSHVLTLLLEREGPNFLTDNGTVEERMNRVYAKAGIRKDWATVRYCASIMRKVIDSLAPSITTLLVRGKVITVGVFRQDERIITRPTTPAEITQIIYGMCQSHDIREAVIQQEMIIALAKLIPVKPQLFDGMLKIRVGWLLHAMRNELKLAWNDNEPLYCLSPHRLHELLQHVLGTKMEHLSNRTWLQRRQFDGALNRTPPKFYDKVWDILDRTPEGMQIADSYLPQQPTLSDMTQTDLNFALRVEQMFSAIAHPEYRQLMVELLTVISVILQRNPELEFKNMVHMDSIIKEAYGHFKEYQKSKNLPYDMDSAFYNIPPAGPHGTTSYLAKVVAVHLLDESPSSFDAQPCQVS
ncbi:phosphorylase b kinase regulatory subunit beta-like [Amphiura filiformis]|uniref:phosphorylase b kinase regulatory subunit beta-like n=1 Tax=Amphiura filiformis TaxID=82378 RepID=UPI003B20C4A4